MTENRKENTVQSTKKERRILDSFNELFISYRGSYISQKEDGSYFNSSCFNKKLTDREMLRHIRQQDTIGIFAGKYTSKFILFDIDMADKSEQERIMACNRIISEIENVGIPRWFVQKINSGSKGFHLVLFFNGMMNNTYIESFYNYILIKTGFNKHEVELRATHTMGVKLPLSINKKSGNVCCFVDDNFQPIADKDYICKIIPYDIDIFIEIVRECESEYIKQNKIEVVKTKLKENYKQPKTYDDYYDKEYTVEKAIELEENGLQYKGSRNNSLVKLAIYYNTLGYNHDNAVSLLTEWMTKQDKKMYSTSWENCIKDIEDIAKWISKKNITIVNKKLNIEVYDEEIEKIMKLDRFYQQVVMYAFLCHSKRYATETGIFYMTAKQVVDSTCIQSMDTCYSIIDQLSSLGYIEIVQRNVRDGLKHKANKYKVLIRADENVKQSKITIDSDVVNLMDNYCKNINEKFTKKELRKKLSSRCYSRIINNGDVKYKNKKVI